MGCVLSDIGLSGGIFSFVAWGLPLSVSIVISVPRYRSQVENLFQVVNILDVLLLTTNPMCVGRCVERMSDLWEYAQDAENAMSTRFTASCQLALFVVSTLAWPLSWYLRSSFIEDVQQLREDVST